MKAKNLSLWFKRNESNNPSFCTCCNDKFSSKNQDWMIDNAEMISDEYCMCVSCKEKFQIMRVIESIGTCNYINPYKNYMIAIVKRKKRNKNEVRR